MAQEIVSGRLRFDVIRKSSAGESHYLTGWASVAADADGIPVVDSQDHVIAIDELQKSARSFMRDFRASGDMHEGAPDSDVVESFVFHPEVKKALGIPDGTLPDGWLVTVEVSAAEFEKTVDGSRLMFSIEGEAQGVPA